MDLIPLGLILSGFLALPAAAAGSTPAPALVRLDQVLTQTLSDKAQGRLAPDRCAAFAAKFRVDLAAAKASVPPTPANADLRARILARLGQLDGPAAGAAWAPASADARSALSRTHFKKQTAPAVIAAEKAVLASEPFNDDRSAQGVVEAGGATQRSRSAIGKASRRAAANILANLPTPPALTGSPASKSSGPSPFLPLAAAAGLGAAAYGISKSKGAYVSTNGLDDAHPKPVGRYQRLVANTILAGAAGAVIYLTGGVIVSAAPAILSYATNVGTQGLRLAGSEAGAINPGAIEKAEEAAPQAEAAAADTEQIVIRKGEILNRVWHSEWTKGSNLSGPEGSSFCRGACLPIHAARAVVGRGLNVGVINNAQAGGLYRATEDFVMLVRQSIGGYDEELLLRSPADFQKLELLPEHVSSIPPSGK